MMHQPVDYNDKRFYAAAALHGSKVTMIDQTAEALIHLGNRAVEQGNDALARWLYEEGLTIWRALDDAPCVAYALERLRTLEGTRRPRTGAEHANVGALLPSAQR